MVSHNFLQLCIILKDFKESILHLFSKMWDNGNALLGNNSQVFIQSNIFRLIFKVGGGESLEHWNWCHLYSFQKRCLQ